MWQEFVKLFVLAVNVFEDCVHANLISTTSAQLVCVACVFCTWVCACMFICGIISPYNRGSIFPCAYEHVYERLHRWVLRGVYEAL